MANLPSTYSMLAQKIPLPVRSVRRLIASTAYASALSPGYFECCWPGSGQGHEFEFVRFIESGDEVVVTYESKVGNTKGRNTEIQRYLPLMEVS